MRRSKTCFELKKREETGFSVENMRGRLIVETEKVLEMFECVDGALQSLWMIESACNKHINRESES